MKKGLIIAALLLFSGVVSASTCFGTTSNGRLEGGCKLPLSGENFSAYSSVLSMAGRTYVHCTVRDVLINSFKALQVSPLSFQRTF